MDFLDFYNREYMDFHSREYMDFNSRESVDFYGLESLGCVVSLAGALSMYMVMLNG